MIRILEDNIPSYNKLLSKQGYTYKTMFDFVIDVITDYYEYPGINLAYNTYYKNEVMDFTKEFIAKYIIPKLELSSSEDYSELFNNCIEENNDTIKSFELNYKDLIDNTYDKWQDEIDNIKVN